VYLIPKTINPNRPLHTNTHTHTNTSAKKFDNSASLPTKNTHTQNTHTLTHTRTHAHTQAHTKTHTHIHTRACGDPTWNPARTSHNTMYRRREVCAPRRKEMRKRDHHRYAKETLLNQEHGFKTVVVFDQRGLNGPRVRRDRGARRYVCVFVCSDMERAVSFVCVGGRCWCVQGRRRSSSSCLDRRSTEKAQTAMNIFVHMLYTVPCTSTHMARAF
jgi:hypothetical protein